MAVLFPKRKAMAFEEGKEVEVCSREAGFVGSYFEATILKSMGEEKNKYLVKYRHLVREDDLSTPLEEIVMADEARPRPPQLPPLPLRKGKAAGFASGDKVDAFDNDGWWVGKITRETGDGGYWVYFETYGDHIAYPEKKLRLHLEWVDGHWFEY